MTVGVRNVAKATRAEVAAGRHALIAASIGRRPKAKRGRVHAKEPVQQRLAYTGALLQIVHEVADAVRDIVLPVLRVRLDAVGNAQVQRALDNVQIITTRRISTKRIRETAQRQGTQLDLFTAKETTRQVKALIGIEVASVADTTQQVARFVADNVKLIRSIPEQLLAEVETVISKGVTTGLRVESLAEQIEERFAVAQSRATLIARDQTMKLQGELTQVRQQALGVDSYTWQTSGDERVREEHRALDGKVFKWSDPPSVGHPGSDFQCRCQAEFNADALLESLGL